MSTQTFDSDPPWEDPIERQLKFLRAVLAQNRATRKALDEVQKRIAAMRGDVKPEFKVTPEEWSQILHDLNSPDWLFEEGDGI